MTELSGAQIAAKIFKEEGVEFVAGVHGANVFELLRATDEQNIKMLHMRHEQSAVYLCDGWGKASGRPGVCFAFGPPGTLNMVAGMAHSYLTRSPIIAFGGGRSAAAAGWTRHKLANEVEVFKPVTKWAHRIETWQSVSYYIQRAFREATTYPPGPVFLEFPSDIQSQVGDISTQSGYLHKEQSAALENDVSQATIEKLVRMLLDAEKPVIIGGNGVYWAQASDEFRELVELLRIPTSTRELARGIVPDDHPLSFRGRYSGIIMSNADVVVIFGLMMTSLESYGQPPLYKHDGKKYILISESAEDLDARMPTEMRIMANPKRVLRQMIECARDILKEPPARTEWLGTLTKYKENYIQSARKQAEAVRDAVPINPYFLAQEAADFLDENATIIIDSFMFGGFMPNRFVARRPGHVLDAGLIIGVGHSVGMAIGAQLARPGTQVLGLLGDGGFGIAGFDMESAVRYKIPAVWLLYNNDGWMSTEMQKPDYTGRLGLPIKDSYGMTPGIRYDRIVQELGGHAEHVTEPGQIRPAMERAFNSGKPSVIHVVPDNTVLPPFLYQGRLRYSAAQRAQQQQAPKPA